MVDKVLKLLIIKTGKEITFTIKNEQFGITTVVTIECKKLKNALT